MTAARRAPASIMSPCMTASRWPICSATTRSTTRPTAKTIATAPTTTTATIAAMKARPTTRRSSRCGGSCGKNQLACLLLAQGVPLILAGDEVGNSQNGNNNAYCQDNEIGWVGLGRPQPRRRRPHRFRRPHDRAAAALSANPRRITGSMAGAPTASYGVLWLTPAADEMKEQDWNFPEGRFLAYVLGPVEPGQRADLHRAQRRARGHRVQTAEDAGIQELAAAC